MPRRQGLESEKEEVLDGAAAAAVVVVDAVAAAAVVGHGAAETHHDVLAGQAILRELQKRHECLLKQKKRVLTL